jgi:hypothetical protein
MLISSASGPHPKADYTKLFKLIAYWRGSLRLAPMCTMERLAA